MKTTINLEIHEFNVPNFVTVKCEEGRKEEGFRPSEGIPLSDLSEETLQKLCNNFVESVFKKAKKNLPPVAG